MHKYQVADIIYNARFDRTYLIENIEEVDILTNGRAFSYRYLDILSGLQYSLPASWLDAMSEIEKVA